MASWGLLGASWGVLGASRERHGASWGVLGASWGGGLGSPGGLGGLLEGFWEGPGVVSEVPGGTPDIGSRSGIGNLPPVARGSPAEDKRMYNYLLGVVKVATQ